MITVDHYGLTRTHTQLSSTLCTLMHSEPGRCAHTLYTLLLMVQLGFEQVSNYTPLLSEVPCSDGRMFDTKRIRDSSSSGRRRLPGQLRCAGRRSLLSSLLVGLVGRHVMEGSASASPGTTADSASKLKDSLQPEASASKCPPPTIETL